MRSITLIAHVILLNIINVDGFMHSVRTNIQPIRVSSSIDDVNTQNESYDLPEELEQMCNTFALMRNDKERYMRLLQLASTLPPVDESILVPENVVPGCLSTVHVDCTAKEDKIYYEGESDGLLTKGLLVLLIKGLSGCTLAEIEGVDPAFIRMAKIDQSLTPSRNNGFLNMLAVMKNKAKQAVNSSSNAEIESKPMYNAILSKLTTSLQPSKIELVDNSHEHAGHAGMEGNTSKESHFKLYIVSQLFEGVPLVKRHQVIYALLPDVMKEIHALQIQAKAPSEL